MTDSSAICGCIVYALPAVTSAVCMMVVMVYRFSSYNRVSRKLADTCIMSFFACCFSWICMDIYLLWPAFFIVVQSLFYFCFCFFNVAVYHIVFILTGTGKKEKFPVKHTAIAAVIPVILLLWSLSVPMDAQVFIVETRGEAAPGYEAYSRLFLTKPLALFIWNVVYSFLSLRRIIRYRREIPDYSADEGHSSRRWMMQLLLLKITPLIIPLVAFVFGKGVLMDTMAMVVPVLLITMQSALLCYNIVAENYVIITESEDTVENGTAKGKGIDKERLERYIRSKKPYLNPKLRITDMAGDLHTNRTYLSNFINAGYGMNFSRWVNRMRLEELDKMRQDPALRKLTGMELVIQAGFTNYRAYVRVKKQEDRVSTIGE